MAYKSFEEMPAWQKARDKLNFYYDSRGSLAETKNHLIYGFRVRYFGEDDYHGLTPVIEKTWRELNTLISSLQNKVSFNIEP